MNLIGTMELGPQIALDLARQDKATARGVVLIDPATGLALSVLSNAAGVKTAALLTAATMVGPGPSVPGISAAKTYQAVLTTSSGNGSATVVVEGSNDGIYWDAIGPITLTIPGKPSDSGYSDDRYAILRGNLTGISGTGAAVNLTVGY